MRSYAKSRCSGAESGFGLCRIAGVVRCVARFSRLEFVFNSQPKFAELRIVEKWSAKRDISPNWFYMRSVLRIICVLVYIMRSSMLVINRSIFKSITIILWILNTWEYQKNLTFFYILLIFIY